MRPLSAARLGPVSIALSFAACSKLPAPAATGELAPVASAASTAPVASSPLPSAAPAPAPRDDAREWSQRLCTYFAKYAFDDAPPAGVGEAIAGFYAPTVAQFITLENTTPAVIASTCDAFFKGKRHVRYAVASGTVAVTADGPATDVDATLNMRWQVSDPDAPNDAHVTHHDVDVDVRLVFDDQSRVTHYLERHVHARRFRVVKPTGVAAEFAETDLGVPFGAIVDDTHDYAEMAVGLKGTDRQRKVRFKGTTLWVPEVSYAAVPAPSGGSAALEIRYLQPIE